MLNVCKRCRHYNKHLNKCWVCKKAWDEVQDEIWNNIIFVDEDIKRIAEEVREALDKKHKREGEE